MLDDPDQKFLDACESMVCTFPPLVKGGQSLRLPVNIEIRKQINALRRMYAQFGIRALPTGIKDDRRRVPNKVVFAPVRSGESVFLANRLNVGFT